MEDILVYSDIKNEHVKHVKMVFNRIKTKKFENQNRKMQISSTKNNIFGIRHYSKKLQMEVTKVDSNQIWLTPKNTKDLQKLLGFIRFY